MARTSFMSLLAAGPRRTVGGHQKSPDGGQLERPPNGHVASVASTDRIRASGPRMPPTRKGPSSGRPLGKSIPLGLVPPRVPQKAVVRVGWLSSSGRSYRAPCARCTRPVPCPDLGGAGLVARIMLGADRGRVGVFRDARYRR